MREHLVSEYSKLETCHTLTYPDFAIDFSLIQ